MDESMPKYLETDAETLRLKINLTLSETMNTYDECTIKLACSYISGVDTVQVTISASFKPPSIIHARAFVPVRNPDEVQSEPDELWIPQSASRSKILIFEPDANKKKVIRFVLFVSLGLNKHVKFFNNGRDAVTLIKNLFKKKNENQVALVLIDFHMPELGGVQLISETRTFMEAQGVRADHAPHFAFRAQTFWDLSQEQMDEVFSLGITRQDILEQITSAKVIEKYFQKINYFYRTFAESSHFG